MAVKFHLTRNGQAPHSTSKNWGGKTGSETCLWTFFSFCFLTKKAELETQFREGGSKYSHNLPCEHTFMRSVLFCHELFSKIPPKKRGSTTAWIKAAHCHRRSLAPSEATANNRRSVTRPPANQSGVVQQSDQWPAGFFARGRGYGAFPGLLDKPLCFGRPVLIPARSCVPAWIIIIFFLWWHTISACLLVMIGSF